MANIVEDIGISVDSFSLKTFRTELKEAIGLLEKLEFGGIISDKDFKKLDKLNKKASELFI
jgi:hypothetical protein